MNKYDEMVVRITIFCREPLNFGLLFHNKECTMKAEFRMMLWVISVEQTEGQKLSGIP